MSDFPPFTSWSAPAGDPSPALEVDRAVAAEDADRARRRAARHEAAGRWLDLPRLLRWIGGSVLVAAAFVFMVQSWSTGDDVGRYAHFLAFTAALGGAGFFVGLRMGDEKGARTFLGLAAAAVPVHFTVLGALLYSQFRWMSGLASYPDYARFLAPDGAVALLTAAVGVAVLVPVSWSAFLAFARPRARQLTLAYLLANAALLVPTRNADLIGLLALAVFVGTAAFDRLALGGLAALRTREGRFARGLLAVPFVVLVGRTFNLYQPSTLFYAALWASLAFAMFELLPALLRSARAARASQGLAALPTALAWACTVQVAGVWRLGHEWILPLLCLPLAALYGVLSLRARGGGAGLRRLAALVATGGATLELVLFPGVGSSALCLTTAIAVASYGFAAERRGLFVTGLAALGFALLYHLRFAADLYALSPWGSLAAIGTATVLAASLLERHHRALAARLAMLRARIGAWES